MEQFPDKHDIFEQSAFPVTEKTNSNFPDGTSSNFDVKHNLIPTFVDNVRIISCPNVTLVDAEHALKRKNLLRLSTDCCLKRAPQQSFGE
jgi:hypothetical protein